MSYVIALANLSKTFDFSVHAKFREEVASAIENGNKDLTLDFNGVSHIDSSAIGMLIIAQKEIQKVEGQVTLLNMNSGIQEMLTLTRVINLFKVGQSE